MNSIAVISDRPEVVQTLRNVTLPEISDDAELITFEEVQEALLEQNDGVDLVLIDGSNWLGEHGSEHVSGLREIFPNGTIVWFGVGDVYGGELMDAGANGFIRQGASLHETVAGISKFL